MYELKNPNQLTQSHLSGALNLEQQQTETLK